VHGEAFSGSLTLRSHLSAFACASYTSHRAFSTTTRILMPLQFRPSENIARLKESATLAVAAKARTLKAAGVAIIDLGAGEPDFDTPQFIIEAANRAMREGATRYTATEGIPQLREAIAADANLVARNGMTVKPNEVVVSNGSKQSLYNACVCCFGPIDEVLIPTPSWTSYYEMVELARATGVPVYASESNSLKVTAEDLEQAATPRTRGVMLNSPSNPTGAVYSRGELESILDLARTRNWWVISDEIYRRITYGVEAPSVLEVADERDNLIVINGVAKAYAMTGWRIGWSIAPVAVTRAMIALQSHTTSNPSSISQHAALAALSQRAEADAAIDMMVREFNKRRNAVVAAIESYQGIRYVNPEGAFYLYINVGDYPAEGAEAGARFSEELLEQEKVAVVPGNAFLTPDWIRMSFATTEAVAVEGVHRIGRCLTHGRELSAGAAR
jgi:aspartate aminotransferase